MEENIKKKGFWKKNWIYILCVVGIVGSLAFYFYPNVNDIQYQINKPDPYTVKYAVTNPNLLQDNISFPAVGEIKISEENKKEIKTGSKYPTDNRLVIPKIGVDASIVEGNNLDVLLKYEGVWREGWTGSPTENSNMVLAGHRFQYLPPNTNTFYHLNKLGEGDKIIVYWKTDDGVKDFVYQIYKTYLVNPDETFVRNYDPSNGKEITLYTCGPEVGQNNKRIVVKARILA